jgi:predicted RNA methylase
LQSGKAISKTSAALCLLDIKRTALFIRGINKALEKKVQEKKEAPIQVLYAGTGPFGTLLFPLLTLEKFENIIIDLVEINQDSIEALKEVIQALQIEKFIGEIFCNDASQMQLSKEYDIVISETMQSCLKNEPQVAIMQNIIPQLNTECIFIPETITIDAILTNPKAEADRMLSKESEAGQYKRHPLGNIVTISRTDTNSIMLRKIIAIPNIIKASFPVLTLITTVKIYEDEIIANNESSITLPKYCFDLRNQDADTLEFWYQLGAKPHVAYRILKNELIEI